MNKTRLDRMKISEIRHRVGLKAVITEMLLRRLTWFGQRLEEAIKYCATIIQEIIPG